MENLTADQLQILWNDTYDKLFEVDSEIKTVRQAMLGAKRAGDFGYMDTASDKLFELDEKRVWLENKLTDIEKHW